MCFPDIFIAGMFMPGMFAMLCFLAGFVFEVLFFCAAGFLLFIFMPGIFCMSWACVLPLFVSERIKPVMKADKTATRTKALKPNFFIVPPC